MCGSHEIGGENFEQKWAAVASHTRSLPHALIPVKDSAMRAIVFVQTLLYHAVCSQTRLHHLTNALQQAEPLKASPETQDHNVPRAHECPGIQGSRKSLKAVPGQRHKSREKTVAEKHQAG